MTVGRFGIKLADKGGFMKKRIIIFAMIKEITYLNL